MLPAKFRSVKGKAPRRATENDRRNCNWQHHHRRSFGFVVGDTMIATIAAWLQRRKPVTQPPAPQYVQWTAIGAGDQNNSGIGSIDGERLKLIFRAIENRAMLEIKRP
jgi:hypothetical protein